jgi:hypothetical protein
LTGRPIWSHQPGALNRIVRIVVAVFGCLHLCGGHWGVMQAIAWTNMIVEYSAQDGLVQGTRKTFDGEHPCCMCKAIEQAKKQESGSRDEKLPQVPQGLVLKDCLLSPIPSFPPPAPRDCVVLAVPGLEVRDSQLGDRPPVPPPRVAV